MPPDSDAVCSVHPDQPPPPPSHAVPQTTAGPMGATAVPPAPTPTPAAAAAGRTSAAPIAMKTSALRTIPLLPCFALRDVSAHRSVVFDSGNGREEKRTCLCRLCIESVNTPRDSYAWRRPHASAPLRVLGRDWSVAALGYERAVLQP